MTKEQMLAHLAEKASVTKSSAERVLNELVELIEVRAHNGEETRITGFGTFAAKTRAGRTGRNPQTGASMQIPAKTTLGFKPAGAVVAKLN